MSDNALLPYPKDEKGRFLSGNIGGGRQKGSRNKLGEAFIEDIHSAWQEHGKQAIKDMIAEKPGDFVKCVASLMPKEATLNVNHTAELSDDELAERIRTLAAQLAPFLVAGTGDAEEGVGRTEGAAIAARVH